MAFASSALPLCAFARPRRYPAWAEYADFAACPSNAIDEVKAVCDMVCRADCTGGAVAETIDYILSK